MAKPLLWAISWTGIWARCFHFPPVSSYPAWWSCNAALDSVLSVTLTSFQGHSSIGNLRGCCSAWTICIHQYLLVSVSILNVSWSSIWDCCWLCLSTCCSCLIHLACYMLWRLFAVLCFVFCIDTHCVQMLFTLPPFKRKTSFEIVSLLVVCCVHLCLYFPRGRMLLLHSVFCKRGVVEDESVFCYNTFTDHAPY